MINNLNIFCSFYKMYNNREIKNAYNSLAQKSIFSQFYRSNPFSVEIRMKKDVLAMQLASQNPVSMELMTVIAFYFDKYNEERNCVYTKKESNIKKFFEKGIEDFVEYGGSIKYNLSAGDKGKIIDMYCCCSAGDALHQRLIENFDMLKTQSFREYKSQILAQMEKEDRERHIKEVTCMDLPLDWENAFSSDKRAEGVFAETPADGLVLSLNDLGRVDIEFISQITGYDMKEVITELGSAIYQNPDTWEECFYKGWETADEYLSGRVAEKREKACSANLKYKGYFERNVKALDRRIPKGIMTDDIYVTLGSPWVPADVIDKFIEHLFGERQFPYCSSEHKKELNERMKTIHDDITGTWEIPCKSRYNHSVGVQKTYGTQRMEALHIMEKTLNMKTVVIMDEISSPHTKSGKKRVLNKEETLLAQEKQKKLIADFKEWVWQDAERKEALQKIYEKRYCSNVIRYYDGSFLKFPQMDPAEHLYDYQKNAVARIMFSPNTLLAHDVGAGKTYVMIAAGMEMRRIGISKKNLYVVPNTLVGQWKEIFLKLYPQANLLCVEPKSFAGKKRYEIIEKIRDNDYDGIIIAYSSFELIPVSKEYYRSEIEKQLEDLERITQKKNKISSSWNKKSKELNKALADLESKIEDNYDLIYFDQLGINTLFVDEAHNFKNVPIKTQINRVYGISTKGSSKCTDMMDKVKIVQNQNDGRGVVFATGTPISNSLTDIFVMQKYLQNGELTLLDLNTFDSWVGMFAEKTSEFEIDVDTNQYRLTDRFARFHNMPELSTLLAGIADFHNIDISNGIPTTDGYKDVRISKTAEFEKYLQEISDRAEAVRKRYVNPKDDNMLKITTDGRKAALDLRLVDKNAIFTYQSKVANCAENVFDIYQKTYDKSLTQLIFCDVSTPKQAFNIYDELKRLLTDMGVASDDIAYIHDADTEKKREKLFEKVRKGKIRILIGSTFKLGLGVNVQDKLVALHHLDVPWRPSDMTQREGRILRKGNENEKVEIYRYITEGSFDAYSWQLLESKQRTISEILAGCMTERMCKEIADTVLDYAEVKAISIGNPLLKKRVETANKLSRSITLQRKYVETRHAMEAEIQRIPEKIVCQNTMIENCRNDIAFYEKNKREYSKDERKILRKTVYSALIDNELAIKETHVCKYQGFDIILPANMLKTKPFLYLVRNGRYYVEIGLSESGIAVRLDNALDGLEQHLANLKKSMADLQRRKTDLEIELQKKGGYSGEIEMLKAEIKRIDKELGVK